MGAFRKYRPALAAFVLMMSMALTTTALSFFVEPVCGELGLGRGSFTVTYSILTAAGTLASPFLGQAIQRRGVRQVAAVSAVWVTAGLTAFSFSRSLWSFYLTAALTGIFGTACVSLCAGVIVQTRYRGASAAGLTGLVMSGSGLSGMLVSMVLPGMIKNFGWRTGYRLAALSWLALGLAGVLLLDREPERTTEQPAAGEDAANSGIHSQFGMLAVLIFLLSAATGIQQHLPAVLGESGRSTAQISAMMSLFTAALALGKIFQGFVYGKMGPVRGGLLITVLYAAGFLLLRAELLLPGLLLLALGMGTVTTLMPILARRAFSGADYAARWSILSAVSNLGALAATPLFGMAFDAAGSYKGALSGAALLLVPAMVGLAAGIRPAYES